jgi:5-methylcytosine-specific restriction endonuclease McrA
MCQLDAHHVDGNHENNDPTNIQTLCANCHRLVTVTGAL